MDDDAQRMVTAILRDIRAISSVPYKATGKMAHITGLAGAALILLGEEDPEDA